jgi:hypothetical protein
MLHISQQRSWSGAGIRSQPMPTCWQADCSWAFPEKFRLSLRMVLNCERARPPYARSIRSGSVEPKDSRCFRFRNRIKAVNRQSELRASMVPGCQCMGRPDDGKNAKRPYEKPTIAKLSPEQAKLKRLGHASESHQVKKKSAPVSSDSTEDKGRAS